MILSDGQKIVMIGDSITDCGRTTAHPPFGVGYAAQVRDTVTARLPHLSLLWENRGVGGDTVRHLAARWQRDVIDERPDVLTVMIGINDVWRRFGENPMEAVPADEYVSTLATLLQAAQETCGATIVVGSPFVLQPDRSDPMRAAMDIYGGLARDVAVAVGASFIDMQAAFDTLLETVTAESLCDERVDLVHLNDEGHGVIAAAFVAVLTGAGEQATP